MPEVALVLTTYQKPAHLRQVLLSIALQEGVAGGLELVVADDGSTDETPALVQEFARGVPFRVGWTTHPHTVFCPARSRNEGAAARRGAVSVVPRRRLRLAPRPRGPASGALRGRLGDGGRLHSAGRRGIAAISPTTLSVRASTCRGVRPTTRRRLAKGDRKFRLYNFLRHPPSPTSSKAATWASGGRILSASTASTKTTAAGAARTTIWACGCGPPACGWDRCCAGRGRITFGTPANRRPGRWKDGPNVGYFQRRGRLTCCRNGLVKRELDDLRLRVRRQFSGDGRSG